MNKLFICLFSLLLSTVVLTSATHVKNAMEYGAKGDGKTLDTEAIQRGIDAIHSEGGGRLNFSPGDYLSGTIVLRSNVEIHLEEGATLLGVIDVHQYRKIQRWVGFVMADNAENIALTGKGVIDGQGRALGIAYREAYYAGVLGEDKFNQRRKRVHEPYRPQAIEMVECKNVTLQGITVRDSASWVQTYDRCENLVIDGVTVDSDAYWNNDGMDIGDCKNVRISNCDVNAADDGICLKSHHQDAWNEDIVIENCRVRSSASAIKFGTASTGGFKNIRIENIEVYDTFRSAIALEAVDGGFIENVVIENVTATNTGNAIFLRVGHRNQDQRNSWMKNVTIRNVKVEIPFERPDRNYDLRGPELPFFRNPVPCSITSVPGQTLKNITLENIEIKFAGNANDGLASIPLNRLKDVPEQVSEYPEFTMFEELPAWAFYVRHVKNLKMKHLRLSLKEQDFRPAFVFDDVEGLELQNIETSETGDTNNIVFRNVRHAEMDPSLNAWLVEVD